MKISLEKCTAKPPKGSVSVNLPIDSIGVLRQMRSTFISDSITDLAESIKSSGQLHPGIVVALIEKEARHYLHAINKTWGTKHSLTNYESVHVEGRGEYYFFLVAGERRYRACMQAKLQNYFCQLRFGMNFSDAIVLQAQENLHEAVPQEESAATFALLWRMEKTKNQKLTLSTFARRVGKSPEAMRKAVRFMTLPISVQRLVLPTAEFSRGVPYGILCELARLQEARELYKKAFSLVELKQYAYIFVAQMKTVHAVASFVTTQIEQLEQTKQGARPLFELELSDATSATKKSVATGFEDTIRHGEKHLRAVARFHNDPVIGKIASQSAVSGVLNTLSVAEDIAPKILQGVKGARGAKALAKKLA